MYKCVPGTHSMCMCVCEVRSVFRIFWIWPVLLGCQRQGKRDVFLAVPLPLVFLWKILRTQVWRTELSNNFTRKLVSHT